MNTNFSRALIGVAAVLIATATGLGAYASHGLDAILDTSSLESFKTGVNYQFIHALGLIGIAIYGERHADIRLLSLAALLLTLGIVLFSGGVYASSLDGPGWIAGLAPTGGISLIAGWIVVAVAMWQRSSGNQPR